MSSHGLVWRAVADIDVDDSVATLQTYRPGASLQRIADRHDVRGLVVERHVSPIGTVKLVFQIGGTLISREWWPDAILAIEETVSTCETTLATVGASDDDGISTSTRLDVTK